MLLNDELFTTVRPSYIEETKITSAHVKIEFKLFFKRKSNF